MPVEEPTLKRLVSAKDPLTSRVPPLRTTVPEPIEPALDTARVPPPLTVVPYTYVFAVEKVVVPLPLTTTASPRGVPDVPERVLSSENVPIVAEVPGEKVNVFSVLEFDAKKAAAPRASPLEAPVPAVTVPLFTVTPEPIVSEPPLLTKTAPPKPAPPPPCPDAFPFPPP